MSVTQTQPSNVNVSIRINSPGDDGPVVQINNAGGTAVVEHVQQVVQRPAARPDPPAEPAGGELPASWDWTWTSACFGGAPRAGAASAGPGWNWHWSCDEEAKGDDDGVLPGLPGLPDVDVPRVDDLIAAVAPAFTSFSPSPATAGRPRAQPERRERPASSSADTGGAGPPPGAGRPPPAPLLLAGASAHAPPVAAHRAPAGERAAAQARPGPSGGGSSSTLPPGSGLGLGAGTALSSMATILLGLWTAVLVTACVFVLPRLRHRRWSGLTWRLMRPPSARLERPG